MPKKEDLLEKLYRKPYPKNFTMRELDQLMSKCNCIKGDGGRGSGVKYTKKDTNQSLIFDQPHPGNELKKYQIEKVKDFMNRIGEM